MAKLTAVPEELVTVGSERPDGVGPAEGQVLGVGVARGRVAERVEGSDGEVVTGAGCRRGGRRAERQAVGRPGHHGEAVGRVPVTAGPLTVAPASVIVGVPALVSE